MACPIVFQMGKCPAADRGEWGVGSGAEGIWSRRVPVGRGAFQVSGDRPFFAPFGEIPEPAALTRYTLALRPCSRGASPPGQGRRSRGETTEPEGDPVDGCERGERVNGDDTWHASLPVTMAGRPRGPERVTL
jgi:hypothetical protein